jgi:cytochrome c biogenesis protein CcdA
MADAVSPLLAFVAGILSILSPCVLPLIPIVFGTAQSRHPLGPIALGAGLAASFTIIGLFVATIGFSLGLDGDVFRRSGGVLLALVGAVLLVPAAQTRLSLASGSIGSWADRRAAGVEGWGLGGQALLGALLGLVWVPCVGPTLGAASVLAAQEEHLAKVAFVMLAFAVGAAIPLTALGIASRSLKLRMAPALRRVGSSGKSLFRALLLILGLLIVTDLDRLIEAYLTQASPDWLLELTTRY